MINVPCNASRLCKPAANQMPDTESIWNGTPLGLQSPPLRSGQHSASRKKRAPALDSLPNKAKSQPPPENLRSREAQTTGHFKREAQTTGHLISGSPWGLAAPPLLGQFKPRKEFITHLLHFFGTLKKCNMLLPGGGGGK